jgi:hypothetical protein
MRHRGAWLKFDPLRERKLNYSKEEKQSRNEKKEKRNEK